MHTHTHTHTNIYRVLNIVIHLIPVYIVAKTIAIIVSVNR